MLAEILKTEASKEKMADLLTKMGLSKEAIEILLPFMVNLSLVHAGLMKRNLGEEVARQVYDLAMFGFLTAHPKIDDEMQMIMGDEEKRKKAIEVVLEAILEAVKKNETPQPAVEAETGTKATLH